MVDKDTKTYDGSVADIAKSLINLLIKDSQDVSYGDTPLDRVRTQMGFEASQGALNGIAALSSYMSAKAAERQATALESLAKTASKVQMSEHTDVNSQAIIDQRESRRDYLASTYSLDTETLTFLWALRGILVDASIKSLSRPDRFDPFRKVTNEEIAWTLRITPEQLQSRLPRMNHEDSDVIDYELLEDFDIQHYDGTDADPDGWMYGG